MTTIVTKENNNTMVEGVNNMKNTISARNIMTKEQFRLLLDSQMKKEQITIQSITVDGKKGFRTQHELTNTPVSRIYVKDGVQNKIKVRNGSRIVNIENKFSWRFLSVAVTENTQAHSENIFGGTIYMIRQANGWIKMYSDLGTNGANFTDLETNKDVRQLPQGEVHIYKGLAWTASNKRQKTMIFMEVTNVDRRFDVLNHATLGALAKLRDKFGLDDSMKTFMALQKAGGYVGNVLTGSVSFGTVSGYIRYYSKWENSTNENFLTEAYSNARDKYMTALRSGDLEAIKVAKEELDTAKKAKAALTDVPTQDGQMYINARVFANMIKTKLGLNINPRVLNGMMLQLRPGTIKASAIIVSEEVFNSVVSGTEAMAKQRGQKVEAVGDLNNILYIADANCIKLDYDMEEEITMQVLAFAKCSTGKTSKQLAETILYAAIQQGENGAQLLYDILKLSVDKKAASLTVDRKARLLTPEEVDSAMEKGYVNDFVMAVAPRFMDQNKAFFNSVWRQMVNAITGMIDGLSGDLTSHNRRLSADPTFILTGGKLNSILNTGEVVINNRKITKTVMVKYPKMGLREYYFSNNVSAKEIKKRLQFHVNKGTITQDEANSVAKFYRELDSFVAVLPAKSVITYACAGLDFDYDGALFLEYTQNATEEKDILTNKVVDLLENNRMKAVVIQN